MPIKIKVKVVDQQICPCCNQIATVTEWKELTSSDGRPVIFANEEGACKYINTYSAMRGIKQEDFKIIKE